MPEIRLDMLDLGNVIEQKTIDQILEEIGAKDIPSSNPEGRIKREWAAREVNWQQIQDLDTKQNLLAFAVDDMLDFIGETYYRNSDGTPILRKDGESNEDYRLALQQSPEGLTSAGTVKSYNFHSSRAHPLVGSNQVNSHSPSPMEMNVYFINPEDEDPDVIASVIYSYIERFIPSDLVRVLPATKVDVSITGTVTCNRGVGLSVLKENGSDNLKEYSQKEGVIKGIVSHSGISEAVTMEGVRIVSLDNWSDVICGEGEYPVVSSITLNYVEV